jgi:hypothetical protein
MFIVNVIVTQEITFPTLYGTRRFFAVFIRANEPEAL